MFLLGHLLPRGERPRRLDAFDRTLADGRTSFPAPFDRLIGHAVEMERIVSRDFFPTPPGDPAEDR